MVHKGSKLAFIPLSRLIPEPRPFSHHVLVMSCEAKVRANAWSYLEGGAKSLRVSLDCPMLHNTHRCRKIDRRPPGEGDCRADREGSGMPTGAPSQEAALNTESPGKERDHRPSVISRLKDVCLCVNEKKKAAPPTQQVLWSESNMKNRE